MRLERVDTADTARVVAALARMLDGGNAVALGGAWLPLTVPEGTGVVVTTSGSTGVPKSVLLSRKALVASAEATAERVGAGVWMLPLQAGYIAGVQVVLRSLLAGHSPVLAGDFSPAAVVRATAALPGGRAYTSLVPAQLQTLLSDAAATEALARYTAVLLGGQALPAVLAERAAAAGIRVVRTYGSTETSGGCVYDGVALNGARVRVEDGEVLLGGRMLADGYLLTDGEVATLNRERTSQVFVEREGERWYRTGDVGALIDGVLTVTGRRDNVLISGGVNVSLDRVESVVHTVPGLAGAIVVAADDERWGQVPVIITEQEPAATALSEARARVERELGVAARPARILTVPELPRLASGKPDRRVAAALV